MHQARRVLVIAYYFPPAGGGGVQRPTKFVKYLQHFGWRSIVLTATEDSFIELDPDLQREIPEDTAIKRVRPWLSKKHTSFIRQRTGAFLPAEGKRSHGILGRFVKVIRDWLLIPDSQILWVLPALFHLRKIAREYSPDIIFATAPPYSVLCLGVLAKLILKRPLFSDFRDPWSEYFASYRKSEPAFRKMIETAIEKKVIRSSDQIIVSTKGLKSYFEETFSTEPNKTTLLYNGYDEEDYREIQPRSFDKFTIVYTGKIVSNLTSATPFLKGLLEFLKASPRRHGNLQVKFIGLFQDREAEGIIREGKLRRFITIQGYLPHAECVAHQLGADLLLVVLNNHVSQPIPGKIFEYMRAKKPILAIVPQDSPVAALLSDKDATAVVSPSEPQAIARELRTYYNRQKKPPVNRFLNQYSRKSQTRRLAKLMDEYTSSHHAHRHRLSHP